MYSIVHQELILLHELFLSSQCAAKNIYLSQSRSPLLTISSATYLTVCLLTHLNLLPITGRTRCLLLIFVYSFYTTASAGLENPEEKLYLCLWFKRCSRLSIASYNRIRSSQITSHVLTGINTKGSVTPMCIFANFTCINHIITPYYLNTAIT